MTKKREKVEVVELETTKTEVTTMVASKDVNLSELDGYENTNIDLNKSYLELGIGEKVRAFTFGFGEFTEERTGEVKPTIELLLKTKKVVFTASTILVSALKNLPIHTPIQIEYIGLIKGGNGYKYKDFKVELLKRK